MYSLELSGSMDTSIQLYPYNDPLGFFGLCSASATPATARKVCDLGCKMWSLGLRAEGLAGSGV